MPAFVPTTKRYVCGSIGCNYLCLEESLLRHHLFALHAHETVYYCKHCNENLCNADNKMINIDVVMKHLKLHDLHLYKCGYCKFIHNLKHKIERHISEKHLDKEMHVIVVRKMESEPEVGSTHVLINEVVPVVSSMVRPWHCCMCKSRTSTREEIVAHVENKHDIGLFVLVFLKTQLIISYSFQRSSINVHYAHIKMQRKIVFHRILLTNTQTIKLM